jgi:hypothetical protein
VPDPSTVPPTSPIQFAPARRLTIGLLAGTAIAVLSAFLVDMPGRLLLIVLAAALLAESGRALLIRPVLTADPTGLTLRAAGRTRHHPWSAVVSVRARTTRRLVSVATLEIDLGDDLIVIPAYRLGNDPTDVAGVLETLRPSGD